MRRTLVALVSVFLLVSTASAQSAATTDEAAKWQKSPQPLENTSCKIVTWLLDNEQDKEHAAQKIHLTLGWWGRGFVEGAAYAIDLPGNQNKAMKHVTAFGLTVDVVTAHLDAYCRANPSDTPLEGVQELLLKALK